MENIIHRESSPAIGNNSRGVLVHFDDFDPWIGKRVYPPTFRLCIAAVVAFVVTCLIDYLAMGPTSVYLSSIPWRILAFLGLLAMSFGMKIQIFKLKRVLVGMALGLVAQMFMVYMDIFIMNRIIFIPLIVMFYLFGVQTVAPLINLKIYGVVAGLDVIFMTIMIVIHQSSVGDYFLVATMLGPAMLFLFPVVHFQRKLALELWNAERENFLRSTIDALSQVLNRRSWYERSNSLLMACRRSSSAAGSLSFLMLDIDHFKKVNDTWGHECGDIVIKKVSEVLVDETRAEDLVGRLGGEEFGILLSNSSSQGARNTAERIRHRIEGLEIEYGGDRVPVTVSLGLCFEIEKYSDLEEIVRICDSRLYEAKRAGRNRIVGD